MGRPRLQLLAKLLISAGLIAYVIKSGLIDFDSLLRALLNPIGLLIYFVAFALIVFLINLRWVILARTLGLNVSQWRFFQISLISGFFGLFGAGSIASDVVKALYAAAEGEAGKGNAVISVLADRVISAATIFFVSGASLLLYSDRVFVSPQLKALAVSIWIVCACLIGAGVVMATLRMRSDHPWVVYANSKKPMAKLLAAYTAYRSSPQAVTWAVLLSVLSTLSTVTLYFALARHMGLDLSFETLLLVVPIGTLVAYLTFLPLGIGASQITFYTLFLWIGSSQPSDGVTLSTLLQAYAVLFGLSGGVFFLKFRKVKA